jgi:peptidoglycan/LPS O-acetylase OafA/YrhL
MSARLMKMKTDTSTVAVLTESADRESRSVTSALVTERVATAVGRQPIADTARIPALDGLRGVASLMVVAYHFGPHIVRDGGPFQFLHNVPPFWFHGVDLFFVLSGFLISGILVTIKDSPRYFRTFYARRAFRIFPLYYAVLIGYVIALTVLQSQASSLGRLFEHPLPLWSYAFYLQNFAMAAGGTFGPIWLAGTWSLAVEEQFYTSLPLVIKNIGERALFRLALVAIAAAPLLRALVQKFKFVPGVSSYVLLPTHMDALAVGVCVMLLLRHHHHTLRSNRRKVVVGSIILGLAWTVYPYVPNPQAIRLAFIETTMNSAVFGAILLCLLMLPGSSPARFLSTRLMRGIGDLAYSTYLFHPIVLCVVFRVTRNADPALRTSADLAAIAMALVLTLGASWLSWSTFESQLVRVGRRFRY